MKSACVVCLGVALIAVLAGCGGGSSASTAARTGPPSNQEVVEENRKVLEQEGIKQNTHGDLLERAPVGGDGPAPQAPIASQALGNEHLERAELEAKIKSAVTMLSEESDWTVSCNGLERGDGSFYCVYFSRAQVLREDGEGTGHHVIVSEWQINQSTGDIAQIDEREEEGSEY